MNAIVYRRPPNRLARLLAAPGGLRRGDAVAAAGANLLAIRDDILAELDAGLARLREVARRASAGGRRSDLLDVYREAAAIAGVAGLCDLETLGRAAYSLCDLSDSYILCAEWNASAVQAHLDAMTLMRAEFGDAEARELLLEGLRSLVEAADAALGLPPRAPDRPASAQDSRHET